MLGRQRYGRITLSALKDLQRVGWARFKRELVGLSLVAGYFVAVPLIVLRSAFFRRLFQSMGTLRYHLLMFLLLAMAAVPIKMLLRWIFNLKYLVSIPELYLNI